MSNRSTLSDAQRALEFLFEPNDVFEVRVLKTKQRTRSGYFVRGDAALRAIAQEDASGVPGVYVTLNPCDPALHARSHDRMKPYAETVTTDKEIKRRRNLLIDADPRRPAGISSTDAEHAAARDRVCEISGYLERTFGIVSGLVADSGNGWVIILPVDLPNDDESKTLCERVLEALDFLFSDDRVKIDTSVANAARLCRCFGTMNRKGDSTPDRPHRRSAIAHANGRASVSRETLAAIAALMPHEMQQERENRGGERFDVDAFLARHSIAVLRESTWRGGRRWILVACVFEEAHGGSSAAIIQHASGALSYRCLHDSCGGKTWTDARELFEPGDRERSAETAENAHSDDAKTQKQAEMLLAQAKSAGVNFVHDNAGVPYALIREAGQNGSQVFEARSNRFRSFLARLYYKQNRKAASRAVLTEAMDVMEGLALFDGDQVEIHLRYRATIDSVCIDLGNSDYQMIFVTSKGWAIVPHGDVFFRRPPALLAMSKPISDGTRLDKLRKFTHADGEHFQRILIFAICAMRGRGPFPILALHGEQGSAKTTAEKVLKALIDPSKLDARAQCRDTHDLAIAANGSYLLAFDNLSDLSPGIADALCRLSTGGSWTTRRLYSDRDEEIFEGYRPVVLNSIEELMARPDLAERTIPAQMPPIPDEDRILDDQFWEEFRRMYPALLGALLDALVVAFGNLAAVRESTKRFPRMADAFLFSLAAEPALRSGANAPLVEDTWRHMRQEAVAAALESSLVAGPFLRLLEGQMRDLGDTWEVTGGEALRLLNGSDFAPEHVRAQRGWPANGKSLMNKLRRVAPALRTRGYTFNPGPRSAKSRIYVFARGAEALRSEHDSTAQSSSPSSSSQVERSCPRPNDGADANDGSRRHSDLENAVTDHGVRDDGDPSEEFEGVTVL